MRVSGRNAAFVYVRQEAPIVGERPLLVDKALRPLLAREATIGQRAEIDAKRPYVTKRRGTLQMPRWSGIPPIRPADGPVQ